MLLIGFGQEKLTHFFLTKTHQQHAKMLSSGGGWLDQQLASFVRNQINYHCCGLLMRGVVFSLRISDSASSLSIGHRAKGPGILHFLCSTPFSVQLSMQAIQILLYWMRLLHAHYLVDPFVFECSNYSHMYCCPCGHKSLSAYHWSVMMTTISLQAQAGAEHRQGKYTFGFIQYFKDECWLGKRFKAS